MLNIPKFRSIRIQIDHNFLLIGAWPILLASFDSGWIFSPVGYPDPWIYFGYFLDFRAHMQQFPDAYYGTRLSWILPGYLFHHLFSPLIANYLLHLAVYYLAVISLYLVLKITLTQRTALITGLIMGSHIFFLRAIGWDYVDGVGLAYCLLTVLLLTCGARFKGWFLFLAGVSCAAMVYANTYWLITLPLLVAYYLYVNRQGRQNRFLASFLFFLCGGVTLTIIFGSISNNINGHALFFAPALVVSGMVMAQLNPWAVAESYWLTKATWLVFPIIILFGSVLFLLRNQTVNNAERKQLPIVFQLMFVGMIASLLVSHLSGRVPVLQSYAYMSYAIPFSFLALGGQLTDYLEYLGNRQFALLSVFAVVVMALPFLWLSTFRDILPFWANYQIVPALVFGIAGMGLLVLYGRMVFALGGLLLCLSLTNYYSRDFVSIGAIKGEPGSTHFEIPQVMGSQDEYLAVNYSVQAILHTVPSGGSWFWYDSRDDLDGLYRAIASFYFWLPRYISADFPNLDDMTPPGHIPIAILSRDENAYPKAEAAFNAKGRSTRLLSEMPIDSGTIHFKITFIDVDYLSLTF